MDGPQLTTARQLLAIAQNGLAFSRDPFDRERFEQIARIGHDMLAEQTGLEQSALPRLYPVEPGYATPKVDVRAGVFLDGCILLVKERSDGLWTVPGGWADVNESPRQAIEKEIREESGYVARAVKLAAVYDRRLHPHPASLHHIYKMFFLCELLGGKPQASIETEEAAFFAEDALPPLSTGRISEGQIHMLFRHWREPGLATEFD